MKNFQIPFVQIHPFNIFFFLAVLGLKLGASHLLGRHATTRVTPPALLCVCVCVCVCVCACACVCAVRVCVCSEYRVSPTICLDWP
jgi:hypothetical protein